MFKENVNWQNFIGKLLIFVLFGLILLALWQGIEILLLVFAGLLLSILLRSVSDFLSRHTPLSGNWSLAIVLFGILGLAALGVWLLSDKVQREFVELSETLPNAFTKAQQKISEYPIGRRIVEQIPPVNQLFVRPSTNVFTRITGFASTAFDVLTNVFIVLVTGIYFAFNPNLYHEGLIKLLPKDKEKRLREVLATLDFTLRRFLLGQFAAMLINGTMTATALYFLNIPFAIPLGIITGLFNFIPNIGPIIASIPAVLIAFSISPQKALYVALLYLAVQNIDGWVTTPLIQQKAVSLPPVLVIVSQFLLAVLFGFLGLLLAVPILAVIFVFIKMLYVEDILDRKVEVKGEKEAKEQT